LLVLLEEIKSQNQTQILLLHQLLNLRSAAHTEDQPASFELPATTLEELKKLAAECQDADVRGKLVSTLVAVYC